MRALRRASARALQPAPPSPLPRLSPLPSPFPFLPCSKCIDTYRQALVVTCDNVGSRQMQQIRISLRGTAVVVMGKYVRAGAALLLTRAPLRRWLCPSHSLTHAHSLFPPPPPTCLLPADHHQEGDQGLYQAQWRRARRVCPD